MSINPPKAPHLVQRKLFNSELSLAAAPTYLSKHGEPSSVEELTGHHLLTNNWIPYWEFKQRGKKIRIPVKPKYSIDSLRLVVMAACEGVGICLIPKVILESFVENEKLIDLLPDVQCPTGIVYLVWADRKLVSARVTAFRELILSRMNQSEEFLASVPDRPD